MRTNIEAALLQNVRIMASRIANARFVLTGPFVIPEEGPIVWALDPNGTDKDVYLPPLVAERFHIVSNVGVAGDLSIHDSGGIALVDVPVGASMLFVGTRLEWVWLGGASSSWLVEEVVQITGAGAYVVTTEAKLVVNKAVASPTPITLPSVATRAGVPLSIYDWRGNVDIDNPILITPAGGQTINNLAAWEVSSGGITLYPSVALNGWLVGAP